MTETEKYDRADREILAAMRKPGRLYLLGLAFTVTLVASGFLCWTHQFRVGLGVAGYTHPVNWAVYITNFVFFFFIAHSGTLISAVLYLFRARYRTSFNRPAEPMTVFAPRVSSNFPHILLVSSWVF